MLQIAQRREVLRLATMEPFKEPARPMSHWDFVLKEMRWMAVDFTEVNAAYASCSYALVMHRFSVTALRGSISMGNSFSTAAGCYLCTTALHRSILLPEQPGMHCFCTVLNVMHT